MTQKQCIRLLAVLMLAFAASPLVVSSPSSASAPAVEPGEISDFPPCDGTVETYVRHIGDGVKRKMMRGIYAYGWGNSPEESRFTEKLGNVIAKINPSEAPKETTRFQLRYFIGNYEESGNLPYHAKFFKQESIRVRIPNAKFDTYYYFQVAALRGDCILYTGGIQSILAKKGYSGNLWCSKKKVLVKNSQGNLTDHCPTAPLE